VILVPFNDETRLEQKTKANWGDVACIIVEPVMGNCASIMPKEGYLELVRELCDQYGIVLIFDEIKTGFRIAKGGAQEYFNIPVFMNHGLFQLLIRIAMPILPSKRLNKPCKKLSVSLILRTGGAR
jgi:hypothetical protein